MQAKRSSHPEIFATLALAAIAFVAVILRFAIEEGLLLYVAIVAIICMFLLRPRLVRIARSERTARGSRN